MYVYTVANVHYHKTKINNVTTCTHQSLCLVRRDDGDLVHQDDGGDRDSEFLRRGGDGRTIGCGKLHVENVRHFSDERQPARKLPTDFLRLFPEPQRLGRLSCRRRGTRGVLLHRGGARTRRRDTVARTTGKKRVRLTRSAKLARAHQKKPQRTHRTHGRTIDNANRRRSTTD